MKGHQEKKVIFQMQNVIHCSHKQLLNHANSGIQKGKRLEKVMNFLTVIHLRRTIVHDKSQERWRHLAP